MNLDISVVAYQPQRGIEMEDYLDFPIGRKFGKEDLKAMAKLGHFPPGLVLQIPGGHPCVVVGKYGTRQHVEEFKP